MIGDTVKSFFFGPLVWNLLMSRMQFFKLFECVFTSWYFLFWLNDNGNYVEACLASGTKGWRVHYLWKFSMQWTSSARYHVSLNLKYWNFQNLFSFLFTSIFIYLFYIKYALICKSHYLVSNLLFRFCLVFIFFGDLFRFVFVFKLNAIIL